MSVRLSGFLPWLPGSRGLDTDSSVSAPRSAAKIELQDVVREKVEKKEVKDVIFWHHYKYLKDKMKHLKKLQGLINDNL